MKVTQVMFSGLAARQFTYKFNLEHATSIVVEEEFKEGVPFITFDLQDMPSDMVFKFAYTLGRLQKRLADDDELFLPTDQYPMPPRD